MSELVSLLTGKRFTYRDGDDSSYRAAIVQMRISDAAYRIKQNQEANNADSNEKSSVT